MSHLSNAVLQFVSYIWVIFNKLFGFIKIKHPELEGKNRLKGVKEIPGPTPLPFFGTTLTSTALKTPDLLRANEERMKRYGPIIKEEHLWGFPIISLLDPDHIELAIKSLGNFRPGLEILSVYRQSRPDLYDSVGITNVQGAEWEQLHSATIPYLTSPKFVNGLTPASDEMAKDFVKLIGNAGPVILNMGDLLRKYSSEMAFYNIFGTRQGFLSLEGKLSPNLSSFLEAHDHFWLALHQSTYGIPWWKYFANRTWRDNKQAEDTMLTLMEDLIQKGVKETENQGVLKQIMEGDKISYKNKRLIALELLLGATDTTIAQTIFILYWISSNKSVAEKLYEELKEVLPLKDSHLDVESVNKLIYLKACLMETFRMTPVAPNVARLTTQEFKVGGYAIPPYSLIISQMWYAQMQEESFYKAKEFLPERWIYSGSGSTPPFSPHRRSLVSPFGIGKRMCPGHRLVKHHLTILVARIFRNFEVQFEEKLETKYEWLVVPDKPVKIAFTKRTD